jgi:hypothetical protein
MLDGMQADISAVISAEEMYERVVEQSEHAE